MFVTRLLYVYGGKPARRERVEFFLPVDINVFEKSHRSIGHLSLTTAFSTRQDARAYSSVVAVFFFFSRGYGVVGDCGRFVMQCDIVSKL